MNILSCTTLYPSKTRPSHGIFVENRLRAVAARGHDIRVVAPVPRFPSKNPAFGEYARFAGTPRTESRHGLPVSYPRYTVFPKIGMTAAVASLTQCFKNAIAEHIASGFYPDVIDAHYYYPDGVAAVAAAQAFNIPVVVTARGTDINLIPQYPRQKKMILTAIDKAAASITVADALRNEMIELGADPSKITTIRNGVDLETFCPPPTHDKAAPLTIASVGHLIERKGHHLVIEAAAAIDGATVLIAGQGPEAQNLKALTQKLGMNDRVKFLGLIPHDELKSVYGQADITVLASSREGWPNVLLESMACGTACVATKVWGSGEVIGAPEAGCLAEERTAPAIAQAVRTLANNLPNRTRTRAYAENFGWAPVAKMVETVWCEAARSGWGTPTPIPALSGKPYLLTIDTEEIFDWNGDPRDWQGPPVDAVERIVGAAEKFGIKPLFFVSHPLLTCKEAAPYMAKLVADGRADCGLHLHNWSTPPVEEDEGWHHSYQANICPDLHRRKLETLIGAFKSAIGRTPIAHRAGRYGAAPWVLDQLAEHGILLDFSPSTGFDFSEDGGPNFTTFSNLPHRRETPFGPQWVFPVSGERKWRRTNRFSPSVGLGARLLPQRLRQKATVGTRLSPEGQPADLMHNLCTHLWKTPGVLLTPSMHSTSMVAGATTYAQDEAGTDAILETLTDWIKLAHKDGAKPISLDDIADATGAGPALSANTLTAANL